MSQLGDIFTWAALDVHAASLEVVRVDIDSRDCAPGSLFFALSGSLHDGAQFVTEAVNRGAVAVVATSAVTTEVPCLVVAPEDIRRLLGHASGYVTGFPQRDLSLVAVTGTNGKTSVTTMVASLARQLSWNGASIGTLTNERTTPAAPELFRTLQRVRAEFAPAPRSVVAVEVSSHALDQQRVVGLTFDVAAFTNLSHDHLDYHHDMESYFLAKAKLFHDSMSSKAVIWTDDPYGQRLANETPLPVIGVGRHDVHDVVSSLSGTTFLWREHVVSTPLVGDYNVDNALVAMSIIVELGADEAAVAAAMADVDPVPGRFEVVHRGDVTVVVDYAHTPDGLARLLSDVRALSKGAVIVVFGCGGDRDATKRPVMGRVASELADITVVTSDNPRHESPDAIIEEILRGADPSALVLRREDRREAIATALGRAQPGDVVVIAGKGHETTQIYADRVVAFDDRVVVKELMR